MTRLWCKEYKGVGFGLGLSFSQMKDCYHLMQLLGSFEQCAMASIVWRVRNVSAKQNIILKRGHLT